MKAKILLFVFLLSASQLSAFGNGERSALLGFIGGVVATNIYYNHNNDDNSYERYDRRVYYSPAPTRTMHKSYHRKPKMQVRKKVVKEVYYYEYSENHRHTKKHHKNLRNYHRY